METSFWCDRSKEIEILVRTLDHPVQKYGIEGKEEKKEEQENKQEEVFTEPIRTGRRQCIFKTLVEQFKEPFDNLKNNLIVI